MWNCPKKKEDVQDSKCSKSLFTMLIVFKNLSEIQRDFALERGSPYMEILLIRPSLGEARSGAGAAGWVRTPAVRRSRTLALLAALPSRECICTS